MLGLLPWIEADETLYSYCSTAHLLSGFRSCERTSSHLLGITHGAKQHDVPSKIPGGLLAGDTSSGAVLACLRAHTVAALYLPFLPRRDQLDAAANFANAHPHARRRLDGRSRSLSASHALKWCLACVADDRAKVGRAYWHVVHQLPSCMSCPKHREVLRHRTTRLKTWSIPDQLDSNAALATPADSCDVALRLLSAVTEQFSTMEEVNTKLLRIATIRVLRQMSVLHDGRSVQMSKLESWFASTGVAAVLGQVEGWGSRLSTGEWVPSQLWRRKQDHPLRWTVLWAALEWPSIEHATFALRSALQDVPVDESGQTSVFPLSEAPTQTPLRVRQALEICNSYEEVQLQLGISRATLLRWLEHDPELRVQWKKRKRADGLKNSFETVLRFARAFPYTTPSALESAFPAEYRYLSKNAPEKLRLITAALPSRIPSQLPLDFGST